jgi:transposase
MKPATGRTPSGCYSQNWRAFNLAQTNERQHFITLLHELCRCVDEPVQDLGRPRLPLKDMIFCAAFKVYTTLPTRRFMTDLREVRLKGLIGKVPHFNSISSYLQMESLTPILTRLIELSSLPAEPFEADFAVDSTGFSTSRYARWLDERQMLGRVRREWVKIHLICGVSTHIVTSVIPTGGRVGDSPHFGRLVAATARNFKVTEVSADKAYLAGENMLHAYRVGATPFIPFKSNCRLDADSKSALWKRMLSMYLFRQPEYMEHYHKRNNVETAFSMIKAKFGERLRSKSQRGQFNEALCKVLCHNLCVLIQLMYEFGLTPEFSPSVVDLKASAGAAGGAVGGGRIVAGLKGACREQPARAGLRKATAEGEERLRPRQLNLFEEDEAA